MVANGLKTHLESKGLMDVTFIQWDGFKLDKTIKVKYSPDLQQKLFSLTALANHWSMLGILNRIKIALSKLGEQSICFDTMLKIGESIVP